MSNAVSALNAVSFDGYCTVAEAGLVGMITLRGDLGSAPVAKAVKAVTGGSVPGQGEVVSGAAGQACWMSPDELLLVVDHDVADKAVAAAQKALGKAHGLVVNVSDARAVFYVTGASCREVIAKLAPADASALQLGTLRRSRIAQVPAAFWVSQENTVTVVCFRSVAQYAFDLLKDAAAPGSEVF